MSDCLTPTPPARPVAPYLGGKRALARRIIERIAAIPHTTYVEPFVGMGGVFFRRPFRARAEVVNDINQDVATLFRVLQRHYQALMDMLRWQLTSRAEFDRFFDCPFHGLPFEHRQLERDRLYLSRGDPGEVLRECCPGVFTADA